ncbi:metallophosphatase [Cytophagales bacterium WSM2-2]|nr:metallophosphatase [Cytophagales bacterium WSM2-2]
MTFQYCSDLHLEFPENKKYLLDHPLKPTGEILVLAGDIVPFAEINKHDYFFDFISGQYQATYWLPGNHEYYNSDISKRSGLVHEQIRSNVFLVNNTAITCNGTRLVFSTLWSKINPTHEWMIQQDITDFHLIRNNKTSFTVADFNLQHEQCLKFLKKELSVKTASTIVVTHHVPTFYNYPAKYKDSLLNEAFASEQFDLIADSGVAYWIYGHHHQFIPEFSIVNTFLVNNQLGYVSSGEHRSFSDTACITMW